MRRAFTLMELLVVVGIMALLAGVAVPAFLMIRKQAKTTNCINNLRQIGIGIKSYQNGDARGRLPGFLLKDPVAGLNRGLADTGQPLEGSPAKLFHCPFDPSNGANPRLGRAARWDLGPSVVDIASLLYQPGSSFMQDTGDVLLDSDTKPWFFPPGGCAPPPDPTWGDGKAHQFRHERVQGRSIPPSRLPIVRCYFHHDWPLRPKTGSLAETWTCAPSFAGTIEVIDDAQKTLNISWDLNTFWAKPWWESDL